MLKRTYLHNEHLALGATMARFHEFELPFAYEKGWEYEHTAVRTGVALFDLSHLGKFKVSGTSADKALDFVVSRDMEYMKEGRVCYAFLPNRAGGAVDDVLVYRHNKHLFTLVVNGENIEKDVEHIRSNLYGHAELEDVSEELSLFAIQGKLAVELMIELVAGFRFLPKNPFTFLDNVMIGGARCTVSQTGYTGEVGFELLCERRYSKKLFHHILKVGEQFGIALAGFAARESLRVEAGFPRYGYELSESFVLNEVELPSALQFDNDEFVGKQAILSHIQAYTRVGATLKKSARPSLRAKVYADKRYEVGFVTSVAYSPILNKNLVMLRLEIDALADKLYVDAQGEMVLLTLSPLPFDYRSKLEKIFAKEKAEADAAAEAAEKAREKEEKTAKTDEDDAEDE